MRKIKPLNVIKFLCKRYYILVGDANEVMFYNFNENHYVFVCSIDEFDNKGWRNIDGFTFKEKLYIMGLTTKVYWKRIRWYQRLIFSMRAKILSPSEISIKIRDGKISFLLMENHHLVEKIKLYQQIYADI